MPTPPPAPLAQTLEVETPELVVLSYTVAGVGSRVYAALADAVVGLVLLIVLLIALTAIAPSSLMEGLTSSWFLAALILLQFVAVWGYYVFCEALFDGQTLGKRSQRLRVVRDGGYSITLGASAVRNLVRIVDMQPAVLYLVGMVSMLVSRSGKRLGDIAAGTIVVKEDLVAAPPLVGPEPPVSAPDDPAAMALHALLSDAEFAVLERFVQRRADLDPERMAAIASQLVARFGPALAGIDGATDAARLARLFTSERAARARGLAARTDTGAARERHAIIAAGSRRWASFGARLGRAQKRGLASLGEEGVREFVRDYRELTADLARLRTAARGREAGEVFYLNRLASGAHNLIYRRRTISPRQVVDFFFVDVPREIRASATPILLAAALFFGPAAIAYAAVVRHPEVAETFIPAGMLDRAEAGVRRAQTGDGYIDDPQVFRPVMASEIIANNVQVAFAAFAFGITAGIMTAGILLFNGVHLGSVFGLYASKGIGGLLLAFVAPHGVLELAAICIAGGAGFLLAGGMLLPGDRTRREALVENGRRAIKLVASTILLLLVAGTLEGLVSPIPWWPLEVKLAVSGATAVLLYVYLRLATGPVRAPRAT
jgi:uncharacterized membrane protein SpoIIM required for sporulation/uncharacterized RDD family membrane protein YckC